MMAFALLFPRCCLASSASICSMHPCPFPSPHPFPFVPHSPLPFRRSPRTAAASPPSSSPASLTASRRATPSPRASSWKRTATRGPSGPLLTRPSATWLWRGTRPSRRRRREASSSGRRQGKGWGQGGRGCTCAAFWRGERSWRIRGCWVNVVRPLSCSALGFVNKQRYSVPSALFLYPNAGCSPFPPLPHSPSSAISLASLPPDFL